MLNDGRDSLPKEDIGEGVMVEVLQGTISGEVNGVCSANGCWFSIVDENQNEVTIWSKTKGVVFTKDMMGKKIAAKGSFYSLESEDGISYNFNSDGVLVIN